MTFFRPLMLAGCAALCAFPVYGQLRICNYNLVASAGTVQTSVQAVLQGMGFDTTAGFSKPIDVLLVQETKSQSTTTQQVVTMLNALYGANTYSRGTFDAATSGGGRTGIVYRNASVSLVSETQVGTWTSSGAARAPMRYQLRPVGYGSGADFYVYNSHYKAKGDVPSEDQQRRMVEADMIRQNVNTLPAGQRVIYAGDFNCYTNTEPMFVGSLSTGTAGLLTAGNGKANDPVNRMGSWDGNATYKDVFSQAPTVNPPVPGFVGGGLNSRFDMQMVTDAMVSGNGVSYIPGSYHTFMNNGSVPLNGSINSGSNTAQMSLPDRADVLTALTSASDHLPLMADYQIPAKMSLSVGTISSQVIVGAAVSVSATVTNSASVVTALGADELIYTGTTSGKLTGTFGGTADPSPTPVGNSHTLSFNTAVPGPATGTVSVSSTSPGAASASLSASLSTTVLAHANPTLSASSDINAATIDFGIRAGGSSSASASFAIGNVADASGYTAGLKLVSITGTGATAQLTTNAGTFNSLAGGTANAYSTAMSTGNYGTFSATYTFATADQALPGAIARENLVLTLHGVVGLGGDADLNGLVDTSDFNILAGNFGPSAVGWSGGDFNGDGQVDSADFGTLAGHFGERVVMASPALGAVVPEPTLLAFPFLTALLLRRRR